MVIHRNKHYYRYWFILIESMNEVSFKAYFHRPCSRDVPLRVKSKLTLVGWLRVRSPQGRSVTLLPRSERVSVGLVIVKVGRQWCPRSLSRREPPPLPPRTNRRDTHPSRTHSRTRPRVPRTRYIPEWSGPPRQKTRASAAASCALWCEVCAA